MSRRDVFEFIVDGTSGLAPGNVTGSAVVAGVCSLGTPGKCYYLGKRSDLASLLGAGPLVDRLNDLFGCCGQDATVVAVPVSGQPGGYMSDVQHAGEGPDAAVSGVPVGNADALVRIVDGGALGTATYQLSLDGGDTWEADAAATPANGQIALGATGATLVLADADQVAGDTYGVTVRDDVGPVEHIGSGPAVTVAGTPTRAAQIVLQIVKSGGRNVGQYQLSLDGGDNFGPCRTVPIDGAITVGDTGLVATHPDDNAVVGDTYSCNVLAPVPTIVDVISALELPMERIDPEFVYVAGPSDAVDWTALGVYADTLFDQHRPTFFVAESRLPRDNEDLNDWVSALIDERSGVAHRFVSVCAAFGEISDRTGARRLSNAGGLLAGRILEIPVQRDIGRVRDQGIPALSVSDNYTESMQTTLEDAGYVTVTLYAGLESAYWGDARTLADTTSDYQFLEVLRVLFKAIRLLRIAALAALKDEAGDPLLGEESSGLAYLRIRLENALDTMVKASPRPELAAYKIDIPSGQDIANNGVSVVPTLIGIPIIKTIRLYCNYVYAGSSFDPRLSTAA